MTPMTISRQGSDLYGLRIDRSRINTIALGLTAYDIFD